MQLVAMGAQDVYLTGNPQITFFKVVYRRHTNFSKEAIKQEWNGSGASRTCTLARNGDLVQEIYILGTDMHNGMIKSVEVEIGGQKIDKHYSAWLDIYDELFDDNKDLKTAIHGSFMPLRFWFNRNPGLALPLIALQYHEVKIVADFDLTAWDNDANTTTPAVVPTTTGLLVNYLYLDTDERRRFAQVSHEYLIEQVQHTGIESLGTPAKDGVLTKSLTLTFNHPVKALFWNGLTNKDYKGVSSYKAKLQLNGHDRATEQGNMYYTGVQPYECGLRHYHSGNLTVSNTGMYSFCLKPAEHQPSGTCNFSRIDNARLVLTLTGDNSATRESQSLHVFAMNYNVLRIMSGMGGLAYSN